MHSVLHRTCNQPVKPGHCNLKEQGQTFENGMFVPGVGGPRQELAKCFLERVKFILLHLSASHDIFLNLLFLYGFD